MNNEQRTAREAYKALAEKLMEENCQLRSMLNCLSGSPTKELIYRSGPRWTHKGNVISNGYSQYSAKELKDQGIGVDYVMYEFEDYAVVELKGEAR